MDMDPYSINFLHWGAEKVPLSPKLVFFFFALVTGPRRSLSLKLGDTRVNEPQIRARLDTLDQLLALGRREGPRFAQT